MRQFSLDMIPGGAQTAVSCNQYEAGDVWDFALYYNGGRYTIPQDATVSITGTKPDGASYNVGGAVVNNQARFVVTQQITACAGRSIAEVLVESETDGTTLYSANFPLLVEPAAVSGNLSPSVVPAAITDTNGNVYFNASDEAFGPYVSEWLDDHPEATTTVQDGAITEVKLADNLKQAVKFSTLRMAALNLGNASTTTRGDCTVFYGDVNGIVDFGADPLVPDLVTFLASKGIDALDFVIISHYHSDHVTTNFATAISTLINAGIDFSDCVFYLPHKDIDWSEFVGTDNQSARETLVKSTLSENGMTYVEPVNGQTVQLSLYTSIAFYNIGDYTDYYECQVDGRGDATSYTVYNNFSMIAIIDHCGKRFLMSGDVHDLAQSKNYQHIKGCDVYKVEHHGVNSVYNDLWYARLVPEFAVTEQYSSVSYETLDKLMPQVRILCDRGAKLLFTGTGTSIIASVGGVLSLETGECYDLSMSVHLGGGFALDSEDDLNDKYSIGEYHCKLSATAASLLNCPVTTAFRLIVENPRGVDSGPTIYRLQRVIPINSTTEYRRYVSVTGGIVTCGEWVSSAAKQIQMTFNQNATDYYVPAGYDYIVRIGNLCIVKIDGTTGAVATSGWKTIFTGCPKATIGVMTANLLTNDGGIVRARVNTDGELQISYKAEVASKIIGTTFCYVTA